MAIIELERADAHHGGKALGLGRLLRAGFSVPPGFVVVGSPAAEVLRPAVQALTGPVAVRSSALGEDSATASFAGQLLTVLGLDDAEQVEDAVRACSASAGAASVLSYGAAVGVTVSGTVPVIVQRMLSPEVAGVAFTSHPVTGADDVLIEAAYGLGGSVVDGTVVPDSHTVSGTGVVSSTVGSKATRTDLVEGSLRRRPVLALDRARAALSEDEVALIARTVRTAADTLGTPLDVEWAIEDGHLWLLQARPITTHPHDAPPRELTSAPATLHGEGCSPGRAAGPARVVRGVDDFSRVRSGDVLVCRTTDPAWTPLFHIVAAVVTETGGTLSHAAIVARELGLPAVAGVSGAMAVVSSGTALEVDGTQGTIRIDTVQRTDDRA